jgi:hypothetical protein
VRRTRTFFTDLPLTHRPYDHFLQTGLAIAASTNSPANSMDATSHTPASSTDAFNILLRSLNPYIDNLQPSFHHFLELPIELRYNVYEEYYRRESTAIACQSWNGTAETWFGDLEHDTFQFLPNICMTSHELSSEVTGFLVSSSTFELAGACEVLFFRDRLFSNSNVNNLRALRRLEIADANHSLAFPIFESRGARSCIERAQRANERCIDIVSRLGNLRELNLRFHAPYRVKNHTGVMQATSIRPFLDGFDTGCILKLDKLRTLTLSADSNVDSFVRMILSSGGEAPPSQGDDAEKLRPVLDLGKQLKDDFRERGQDVEVQVRLRYADQCDVTTL